MGKSHRKHKMSRYNCLRYHGIEHPKVLNSIITATEILKKPLLFFIPIIVKPSILKIIFLFDSIIFVLGKHNTVYLNLQELCLLRKPYNIYNVHNQ